MNACVHSAMDESSAPYVTADIPDTIKGGKSYSGFASPQNPNSTNPPLFSSYQNLLPRPACRVIIGMRHTSRLIAPRETESFFRYGLV